MNGENTIFGPNVPDDNHETEDNTPGIVPSTASVPIPQRPRPAVPVAAPIYGFMSDTVVAYGVPSPTMVYGVPDQGPTVPWEPKPYLPYVPPNVVGPYIFPTPDVFGNTMKELQNLGLKGTDALRLLAIVNWECRRALEIAKACRAEGNWDILKFAKELMGK